MVGNPPRKSPSLSDFPACDAEVESLARELWGSSDTPTAATQRHHGKGVIRWGGNLAAEKAQLFPSYAATAALLKSLGLPEDFSATGPIRHAHRRTATQDIYFVANRSGESVAADCIFRVGQGRPQLWDPVTGEQRRLPQYTQSNGLTTVPLTFAAALLPETKCYLHLGTIHDMARFRLNGQDLGLVWCAPWQVDVTAALRPGDNQLEIEVANRWNNRLVGDQQPADAKVRTVRFASGLLGGKSYPAGRYTFETRTARSIPFKSDSPLLPSGLLGPVTLQSTASIPAR